MPSSTSWPDYLRTYHDSHAGITEALLRRCHPDPYAWLLGGVAVDGLQVLDLACGSAPLFPDLTGARYLGVDASPGELGAAVVRKRGPVVRADAALLPLPDASVDLVVCSMALQILTPLPDVLTELRRVLRPSGLLVAMIPVSRPLTRRDRVRYSQILWRLRRPRLGYANPHVPRLLTRAGWTVTSSQARRFAYPLGGPFDGRRLVDAFYLPGSSDGQHAAAAELASSWAGTELGIPLQRLVASPPPEGGEGAASRPGSHRMPELTSDQDRTSLPPARGPAALRVYSTTWCGSCVRLKRQLDRAGVEYDEIDIERHEQYAAFVMSVNGGNRTVPTVEFPDGSTLSDPPVREVLRRLDLPA